MCPAKGSSEQVDVKDAYVDRMMRDYDGTRDLTIAWDAGNGASGEILRRLTAKLAGQAHPAVRRDRRHLPTTIRTRRSRRTSST